MVGTACMAQQVPFAFVWPSLGKCLWDSFVFKEKVVVIWGDGSVGKVRAM